jgi:hypothetical protein
MSDSPIWKTLIKDKDLIRLEIFRQVLEESGIEAVVLNKKDSNLMLGYGELKVPDAQFEIAEIRLQNFINNAQAE